MAKKSKGTCYLIDVNNSTYNGIKELTKNANSTLPVHFSYLTGDDTIIGIETVDGKYIYYGLFSIRVSKDNIKKSLQLYYKSNTTVNINTNYSTIVNSLGPNPIYKLTDSDADKLLRDCTVDRYASNLVKIKEPVYTNGGKQGKTMAGFLKDTLLMFQEEGVLTDVLDEPGETDLYISGFRITHPRKCYINAQYSINNKTYNATTEVGRPDFGKIFDKINDALKNRFAIGIGYLNQTENYIIYCRQEEKDDVEGKIKECATKKIVNKNNSKKISYKNEDLTPKEESNENSKPVEEENNTVNLSSKDKNDPHPVGRNIIFYGAPGTGKSFTADMITKGKIDETTFKKDSSLQDLNVGTVFRTTFHPDTDYASFVGCYKPVKGKTKRTPITYEFRKQIFLKAYEYAILNPNEQVYLIIEEINRGNCAQIFGDIFQLLDRKDKGENFQYFSNYFISPDEDIVSWLKATIHSTTDKQPGSNILNTDNFTPVYTEGLNGDEAKKVKGQIEKGVIALPYNLTIIATMNTSDQSLFPMDSAFKRRWEWKYVKIDYDTKKIEDWNLTIGSKSYKWKDVLKKLNLFIKDQKKSADKQMGEFFVKAQDNIITYEVFRDKVLFYLFNDVFKGDRNFFSEVKKPEQSRFLFEDLYELGDDDAKSNVLKWLKNVIKVDKIEDAESQGQNEGEDTNGAPDSNDTQVASDNNSDDTSVTTTPTSTQDINNGKNGEDTSGVNTTTSTDTIKEN